ncbi:MAG: ATP-binding cassette domain-containing protein [Gammaproteobacteria bacterium]|nr:ATP-binding cassette domain-containing protein [Gammaproteobacteria bacterium]
MDEIIKVSALTTHYGTSKVLNSIDLSIRRGEIMVIMGGSGSGKSTLLRHILSLNHPSSGSIEILGKDIWKIDTEELNELRKKIGVAFQGGALFGSMTVEDNIAFPLRELTNLDEETIKIMTRIKLEIVNLSGFGHYMPSQLSGGMLKRAAVARAIIMDPQILFFDEPSAGLDPVVAAELDDLILNLRDAMNITIVVVTHELDSAYKIADRITVINKGDLLLVGTVDEIKSSDNQKVQDLINRTPRKQSINAEEYLSRLTDNI